MFPPLRRACLVSHLHVFVGHFDVFESCRRGLSNDYDEMMKHRRAMSTFAQEYRLNVDYLKGSSFVYRKLA